MKKSFLKMALFLPFLAACTAEHFQNFENVDITNPEAISLNTNDSELASRLIITSTHTGSKTRKRDAVAPSQPSIPEGITIINGNEALQSNNYKAENFSGVIKCENGSEINIYVTGSMNVQGIDGNPKSLNIFVLNNAQLRWNIYDYFGFVELPSKNLNINSWGEITTDKLSNQGWRIHKNASLQIINHPKGFFETNGLNINGKFVSFEPVRIKGKFKAETNAYAEFYADTEIKGNTDSNTNSLDILNGSFVYFGGCTHIGGEADKFGQGYDAVIDNSSNVEVENYLSVNGVVYISNNSRLKLLNENTIFFNSQDLYISKSDSPVLTGGHVYSGALCVENEDMKSEIRNINIYADELKKGHDKYSPTLSWGNLLLGGDNNSIYVGEYSVPSCSLIENDEPVLEEEAQILPPSRDTKYSATSIDFNGNLSYISWHTNPKHAGRNFGGVLDIVNIQNRKFEASMTNSLVKYNHAMWNNETIYIAGESEAKGAILCRIKMNSDGTFQSSIQEEVVTLNGRSANCVAALDDNTLITASSGNASRPGGFNVFKNNITKLDETCSFVQAEKAKYVYKHENSILTFNDMNRGQIKLYNYNGTNDLSSVLSAPIKTLNAGKITPEEGKNVCIFDNNYIYVCMGENGLKIYDRAGWPLGIYGIKQVNGVDADNNYIYVAHGYGVSVIDKSTNRIVTTKGNKEASANFIRVGNDGRIYVAYGTSGLRVFKLKKNL